VKKKEEKKKKNADMTSATTPSPHTPAHNV